MTQVNEIILPGRFELAKHSYPATVGSNLHPVVENFLDLDNKSIAARYAALNPDVNQRKLEDMLSKLHVITLVAITAKILVIVSIKCFVSSSSGNRVGTAGR